ncbi:major facilitator superfamily domain-containing protein [Syncephalis fuscata]|nr:major facilitator superfamily domain-containing protein [Syncephalis fuscata]
MSHENNEAQRRESVTAESLKEKTEDLAVVDTVSTDAADEKPLKYQIIALLCTLLLSSGSHFANQAFSASKTSMKQDLDITNANYGVLQSSVSLVNTFIPLIGGVFMDRFGTALGSIICTTMILLGNIIEAISANTSSYGAMIAGRVIYGLGSGAVVIAQETILAHWFRGKALALAIGLQISVSRLSSFLAQGVTEPIRNHTGFWGNVFWVSAAICGLSWLLNIAYIYVMKVSGLPLRPNMSKHQFNPKSVLYFPTAYWFMPLNIFLFGAVWTPFLSIAAEFVKFRFHSSDVIAGWQSAASLAIPVVVSPFSGAMHDRFGYRGPVLILSSILLIIGMALLGFTMANPVIGLILFSFSLTLGPVASTSSIPLLMPRSLIGTGLGINKCALNFGVTIVNIIVGRIQDGNHNDSYDGVTDVLLAISCATLVSSVGYFLADRILLKGLFNANYQKRREMLEERKEIENEVEAGKGRRNFISVIGSVFVVVIWIISIVLYGVYAVKGTTGGKK